MDALAALFVVAVAVAQLVALLVVPAALVRRRLERLRAARRASRRSAVAWTARPLPRANDNGGYA